MTEAPVVVTEAPAEDMMPVMTNAPSMMETNGVTEGDMMVDVMTSMPTDGSEPTLDETEDINTGETNGEDTAPIDTSTCAVSVDNTDAKCEQLMKFTSATCDCYNFCSGKLISCLKFGERQSFSCSGETVAGCTIDQKVVSAAPGELVRRSSFIMASGVLATTILAALL